MATGDLTNINVAPAMLTASAATYYTIPASRQAISIHILICNISAAMRTYDLHLVPTGGSESTTNQIVNGTDPATSLAIGETVELQINQFLGAGDTIQALASATSSVNIKISCVLVEV